MNVKPAEVAAYTYRTEDAFPTPDMSVVSDAPLSSPSLTKPIIDTVTGAIGEPLSRYFRGWWPYLRTAAEAKAAPVDYVASAFMTAVGSAIGNSRWPLARPGWSEPPVLWMACVGRPGIGKTPGINAIVESLNVLDSQEFAANAARRQEHEEKRELAKIKRDAWRETAKSVAKDGGPMPAMDAGAMEPEELGDRQIVVRDATPEALAKVLAGNPRGVICTRDELSGWVASMGRYSGGSDAERSLWLEAFNGGPFTVNRVKNGGQPIRIECMSVWVLGGIQPDRLQSVFVEGDDDGMAARFLWTWPASQPPTFSDKLHDSNFLTERLRWLRNLPLAINSDGREERMFVPLCVEAEREMRKYQEAMYTLGETLGGKLEGHVSKYPGLALRLALILEFAWAALPDIRQEPREISLNAFAAAVDLLEEYFLPMARRCFGNAALSQDERDARTIARHIKGMMPRPATIRQADIYMKWGLPDLGRSKTAEIGKACERLAEANWLFRMEDKADKRPGRPAVNWIVNPRIWGDGNG